MFVYSKNPNNRVITTYKIRRFTAGDLHAIGFDIILPSLPLGESDLIFRCKPCLSALGVENTFSTMPKKGENIYKRKDGRWEGRYIRSHDVTGKAEYGYIYEKTYQTTRYPQDCFDCCIPMTA